MEVHLEAYRQLLGRIDAHSAQAQGAFAKDLSCAVGCSSCCHRRFSVFAIEAESIRHWLRASRSVSEEGHPAVSAPETSPSLPVIHDAEPCGFLDQQGSCRIYPVRPVLCRTHGLPVAVKDHLGELVGDCCPLNFEQGLSHLNSEQFLDLDSLNTMLAALNQLYLGSLSESGPVRIELAQLASEVLVPAVEAESG